MPPDDNSLDIEESLALARLGAVAWNEWWQHHSEWTVDFHSVDFDAEENQNIDFRGFRFPALTSFISAKFGTNSDFRKVEFHGNVNFFQSTFREHANFSGVIFRRKYADFSETTFCKNALFFDATFTGESYFREIIVTGNGQFERTEFNGTTDFHNATFHEDARFENAQFGGIASFFQATISGLTLFEEVSFTDYADFSHATFCDEASFHTSTFHSMFILAQAKFKAQCSFSAVRFLSALDLYKTQFLVVPDFQSTKMDHHVSMNSIEIGFEGRPVCKLWDRAKEEEDAPKYRRLKEMAILAQDHQQEQEFFALEQRAMRGTRITGMALAPSLAYETLSDFGRSLTRPVLALLLVWQVFAYFYSGIAINGAKFDSTVVSLSTSAMRYSATQVMPINISLRGAKPWAENILFGDAVPGIVHALNAAQELLSVVLLFLIGLALRNRFRI